MKTSDFASSGKPDPPNWRDRFESLLERHVHRLTIRGNKATGLCPFHDDRTPSFTANLEKNIWYCFACAKGGGVKAFALAAGEPWTTAALPRQERHRIIVSLRRREAERTARAILTKRQTEQKDKLWEEWRDADHDAAQAAELMGIFYRNPQLVEEFVDLAEQAERDYATAIHRRVYLEAQLEGEVGA